jgi:hypothetical protein
LSYSPDEEPLELAKKAGKVIWFNLLFMTYDRYLNALPCCKNCIIRQNSERMFFTCMIQLSVDTESEQIIPIYRRYSYFPAISPREPMSICICRRTIKAHLNIRGRSIHHHNNYDVQDI